jgi:hypothetical protein
MNPQALSQTQESLKPVQAVSAIGVLRYLLTALALVSGLMPVAAQAAAAATAAPISGEIQHLSLTTPGDY